MTRPLLGELTLRNQVLSRAILPCMIRRSMCLLMCALSFEALAQNLPSAGVSQSGPVVTKLPPPSYPPIALAAHVFGDVELTVAVRSDGRVDSVEVVSGPQILRQAAVDSAKRTQFACRDCKEAPTAFRMLFRYELAETEYCTGTTNSVGSAPGGTYPRVAESMNTVTITGQPIGTCDMAPDRIPVRTAKWLFLWKCGWR